MQASTVLMAFRMTGERLWRKISKDESNILSMQASDGLGVGNIVVRGMRHERR